MESLQNRIDSFSKAKRVKNPEKPSSSVSIKWPHTPQSQFVATPETLAEAGFYFNPSFDDRDNVTCFMCEKQLSDWEVHDDPFDIHWNKCGDNCCWAIVRCGLRGDLDGEGGFIFLDKSRLPTSKLMERARLESFSAGDGWIHDQEKSHGANSRKMARAGFVFTPQHVGDDLATCLYCNVALSGWDANDDPTEEHRKRANRSGYSCPFFSPQEVTTKPASRSQSQSQPKPSSKSQPPRPSRSASSSKHKDLVLPTKTHDGEDGDNDESDAPPASSSRRSTIKGRSASGTGKGAKTPKKLTRSQSRSGLKDVAEGGDEEEQEDAVVATGRTGRAKGKKSIIPKQKARSRSKSVVPSAAELFDNEEEEEEAVKKTTSRSQSLAKGKENPPLDEEEEDIKVLKKSTRGKAPSQVEESEEEVGAKVPKKSTRGKAPSRAEEPGEEKEEVKVQKKSTRGRAPSRIEEPEDDEEEEEKVLKKPTRSKPPSRVEDPQDVASRKPSRSKKIKTPAEPEPVPEPEPEVEEVEEERKPRQPSRSKTKTPASRKPSRAKPKPIPAPKETVEDEDEQPDEVVPPPVVERKKRVSSSSKPSSAAMKTKAAPSLSTKTKGPPRDLGEQEQEAEEIARDYEVPPNEDDEMDTFFTPASAPPPPVPLSNKQREKESQVAEREEDDIEPFFVPKRGTKPKPVAKAMVMDIDKEATEELQVQPEMATKPRKGLKPKEKQPPKERVQVKEKKEMPPVGRPRTASTLKVVEISTDEEGDDNDGGQGEQVSEAKETKPVPETKQSKEASIPKEKPRPQVFVEIVQPFKPTKPKSAPARPPSPPPQPIDASGDVEMDNAESEVPAREGEDAPHEEPVPRTPPRPAAPLAAPMRDRTPEPALAPTTFPIPALSKLPFTPVQNLTEAELDMTVEEWIRYQMEVEYDKFRRDGERELGRFKKRAEEVRGVIERL